MGAKSVEGSALVIGAGGLGGPVLLTLAAAGVKHIVFFDGDAVESSNLNRQLLFGERDVGRRKAEMAAERLRRLFPAATLDPHDGRFQEENAAGFVRAADVVLDCADNFPTRFLVNDEAVRAGRPLVHGAVLGHTAHLLTVKPGETGCLRCLFEAPPEPGEVLTGAQGGVLGALAGLTGALMGAEALRLLAGEVPAYAGRLLVYEARSGRSRSVALRRRPDCPACAGVSPRSAEGSHLEMRAARAEG